MLCVGIVWLVWYDSQVMRTYLLLPVMLLGMANGGLSYAGVSGALESVMQEAHQTIDQASIVAEEQQEHFKDHLQRQIKELEHEIERLREKAQPLQDDVKHKIEEQLKKLQAQKDAIIVKLNKIREGSGEAWEELKQGLLNALEDLKRSIKRASEVFQH